MVSSRPTPAVVSGVVSDIGRWKLGTRGTAVSIVGPARGGASLSLIPDRALAGDTAAPNVNIATPEGVSVARTLSAAAAAAVALCGVVPTLDTCHTAMHNSSGEWTCAAERRHTLARRRYDVASQRFFPPGKSTGASATPRVRPPTPARRHPVALQSLDNTIMCKGSGDACLNDGKPRR